MDNVVGAVIKAVASKDIYAVLQSVKTASEIADLAAPSVRNVSKPGDSPVESPRELAVDFEEDGDDGVNLVAVIVPIVVGVAVISGFIATLVVCSSRARALRNISLLRDF